MNVKRFFYISVANVLSVVLLFSCYLSDAMSTGVFAQNETKQIKVAFIADIHLHAPEAAAATLPMDVLPTDPENQAPILLRSMRSQLNSTRLFNENILVFKEALNDVVERGIKLVALPGDFTDDGQPVNILALKEILDEYGQKHGLRFFAINGNHDPVRPFTRPGGKRDFINHEGKEISVMSPSHQECISGKSDFCSELVKEWGYREIAQSLSEHGFSPLPADTLFETPFNTVELAERHWQWCDAEKFCVDMPDMSYLVEPVEGLWLLAIDANVYRPKGSLRGKEFYGSSNAGYNALVKYKPKLLDWIKDVVARAEKQNKKLVSFSHFPMAEFSDQQTQIISELLGENALQMSRQPSVDTTSALAATGLKLHLGGHMHLFDVSQSTEHGLTNVQVPSLAAYQPGYSIVTVNTEGRTIVETVIVREVKNFSKWFSIYEKEWAYLHKSQQAAWNINTLSSKSYLDFTDQHLQQIVNYRYIDEWPSVLVELFSTNTVGDIVELIQCTSSLDSPENSGELNAKNLVIDFYRARSAGSFARLALTHNFYDELARCLSRQDNDKRSPITDSGTPLKEALILITNTVLASRQDAGIIDLPL
ncbi:metallophosphoesterase [Alteromonas sp. ZYF713]|nr:metallophosphoesterase [Alteromonas sp. ZYF713]